MKIIVKFAFVVTCYCGIAGSALADQFVVEPIVHLVTNSLVAPPAPPSVAPPQYSDSSGSYVCGRGRAISTGDEYRAFIKTYGVGQTDRERTHAWINHIYDPVVPANAARLAYVSVLVALKTDGSVQDALVECSTDAVLNANILRAVKESTFHTELKDSQSAASLERVEYWILPY